MSLEGAGRRLLFLVTEDWYFWAHRLHLARAARDAGYRVVVATRVDQHGERIEAEGFQLERLSWVRSSINPFRLLGEVIAVARLYRRIRPDIVHHVSLRPIVVGSLAALLSPRAAILNALTGLGYVYNSPSPVARMLAGAVTRLLRVLLRRRATITLLENEDDRRFVIKTMGVPITQTAVNRGSGVDLAHFAVIPLPDSDPVTIGCAARMLIAKGISDLVAASRILRTRNVSHHIVLAGAADPDSPDRIAEATVRQWVAEDGIEWLGQIADVRELWRRSDIAVLASHGEGLPLSLVEAAACGRPLVATDVPGCREIARAEVNALLVPPGAPDALAGALERLIRDRSLRHAFGAESRRLAGSGFSSDQVSAATLALYGKLLGAVRS